MKFLAPIALLSALLSLGSFAQASVTLEEKNQCATEAIQRVLGSENRIQQESIQMKPTAMDKFIGRPLVQRGLGSMTEDHVSFTVKSKSGASMTGTIIMVSEIISVMYDPGELTPNSAVLNVNGEKVLCHLSTSQLAGGPSAREEVRLTPEDLQLK